MLTKLTKPFPFWESGCRLVTYPEGENDLPEDVAAIAVSLGYAEGDSKEVENAPASNTGKGKKKQ